MGFKCWLRNVFIERGEEENDLTREEVDNMIIGTEDYSYEYKKPRILETIKGSYESWWTNFKKEPKLVVCLGARRKGKDLALHSIAQGLGKQKGMMVYCIGNNSNDLPNFITSVESIEEVPNDSIVIIGEGGVVNNSRQSMSKSNVGVSKLISVISHKGIYIFYASQTGRKLDVNLITESDSIILLEPSLMMTEMERPVIRKLYKTYEPYINHYSKKVNGKGVCVLYSKRFEGVCRFVMPNWWNNDISMSYKDKDVMVV